jgi:hypothetical protein
VRNVPDNYTFLQRYPKDILGFYGDDAPQIHAGDYETITTRTDFLGVNYYHSFHGEHDANAPMNAKRIMEDDVEKTDFGWNIYPQGLYDILKRIHTEIPAISSLVVSTVVQIRLPNLDNSCSRRPESVQHSRCSFHIPGRYRLRCCPREDADWNVLSLDQR